MYGNVTKAGNGSDHFANAVTQVLPPNLGCALTVVAVHETKPCAVTGNCVIIKIWSLIACINKMCRFPNRRPEWVEI